MHRILKRITTVFTAFGAFATMLMLSASGAFADGFAKDWQLSFQEAASPSMTKIADFHDMLMVIITAISVFVLALLLYIMLRFNKRANPKPSKTTHNVMLEVIWTIIPVLILVVIIIPSMRILFFLDKTENVDMTLKVTGYQWYWGYEYPDHNDINFMSYMVPDEELQPGQKRLLETDNRVVLPVDTNIRLLITAADVLHAWAVPALGVKMDAIPGRFNETWVRIDKEGVYYGQCSELCGKDHAFMPITIEAVSKERFEKWVKEAEKEFSALETDQNIQVAFAGVE